MGEAGSNFGFMHAQNPQLARLGRLAERYFADDPPTALVKLRQFSEFIAKEVAARHGALSDPNTPFDDVLRLLRAKDIVQREIADQFYHLKRVGNRAAHEDQGTISEALTALKIARALGIWFHRTYHAERNFKPGPFTAPAAPADPRAALQAELERLRLAVAQSQNAAPTARLASEMAEAERRALRDQIAKEAEERAFWQAYAEETEANLRTAEARLTTIQRQASVMPPEALDLLALAGTRAADATELDEATARVLIDERLRAAGWTVDSATLRHATGARPGYGEAVAIAEWPTKSGPVDYALFVDGRCVGVIEAKRQIHDVPGRLGQAQRYARDITLPPDELPEGGPWPQAGALFRVPFVFVTNGRPYVKQLATKSGTWFWDARSGAPPRALAEWFGPRDLKERLEQTSDEDLDAVAERTLGVTGLRPYQQEAIHAVEAAVARGQDHILLAMATGTGKTRLAIALMYELLRRKRFRRILFLVDRNALGRQTLDAMSNTDTHGFLKFDQLFSVADMARKSPDDSDRIQVATVQAMIRRLFDDPSQQRPTPGTFDLIIVDEAHRGYTLDAELREEDMAFRSLGDYLSAYRRVLDYFDATKIALTATPALHTREIFGPPVFSYGYRQAVIDGYLIDHRPPRRITTALSQTGISFDPGEQVNVIDPRTGQIDLFDLEDQIDFEVTDFNKKVYTEPFNREVAEAVARECPPDAPGKTLIFATRDDHADILVRALEIALAEEYGQQPHDLVRKITGRVDRPLDAIKAFKNDPRPKYVVTVDLLTTGIDVPAITNLVFVRRVNSRILYDQMIGRATRRCDEIGKEYFRIFDAVDLYANLQQFSDMRPVVVDPAQSFADLLRDLHAAPTDADRRFVRDQIVVKLRGALKRLDEERRAGLEAVLGPLAGLPDRLKDADPAETIALFADHPSLAAVLDARRPRGDGIYVSEHPDELIAVEDRFDGAASPADYISGFEAFVKAQMNAVPALIAATQRPRDLTRAELKEIALLLDRHGYSEANLRQAYGRARNADIAAHIIGFIRQAALGDPLVPYQSRVENGVARLIASRNWTAPQRRWLERIGRALKEQPVSDPALLGEPLFAQSGGFAVIDAAFDHGLADVLKDLNAAIWDGPRAA